MAHGKYQRWFVRPDFVECPVSLAKREKYNRRERPGGHALTCFQQNDLIVLAQVHEASDAFGELHHVLDGVGDVVRALLPHPLSRLQKGHRRRRSLVRSNAASAGLFFAPFPESTTHLVLVDAGLLGGVLHPGEPLHVFDAVLARL